MSKIDELKAPTSVFVESECAIGGCMCPIWEDWFIALQEHAQQSPAGQRLDRLDEVAYDDAIIDFIGEMEPGFRFPAPPCPRADCSRSALIAEAASDV